MSQPTPEQLPEKQYSSVPQLRPFTANVQLEVEDEGTQL
jgi:hypothetical protein